jgi:Carboxypeptidase regulatory-like domain
MRKPLAAILILLALAGIGLVLTNVATPPPGGSIETRPESGRERGPAEVAAADDDVFDEPDEDTSPPGVLEGIVLAWQADGDGLPLPGASVRVYARHDPTVAAPWLRKTVDVLLDLDATDEVIADTTTDAEGRFRIDLPEGGVWLVFASASGYRPEPRGWRDGTGPLELTLEPGEVRTYRVVDTDGTPIAGAELLVFGCGPGDGGPRAPINRGRTGGDGEATVVLGVLDALLVRADGYATVYLECPLDWKDDPIVLGLPRGIDGSVIDMSGDPIEGASVCIDRDWRDVTLTDRDGRFRFGALRDEERDLLLGVDKAGFQTSYRDVRAGERGVRVVLRRVASISGRVLVPEGMEARRVQLHWTYPAHGMHSDWYNVVDERGRFRIAEVCSGILVLEARIRLDRPDIERRTGTLATHVARVVLDVPDGGELKDVTLRMREAAVSFLSIRVLDPDRRPVVEAYLSTRASRACERSVRAGRDGRILYPFAVPAGTPISLTVSGPYARNDLGYVPLVIPTAAGPDLEPHTVILPRRPTATILVRDANGRPLPASVAVRVKVSGRILAANGRGRYVTPPMLWSGLQITVTAEGYATTSHEFSEDDLERGTVEVRLPPESHIAGRLVTSSGGTTSVAIVEVKHVEIAWHVCMPPDEKGRFAFRGVPVGRVIVFTSSTEGEETVLKVLDVEPGREYDLGDIDLGDGVQVHGHILLPDGSGAAGAEVRLLSSDEEIAHVGTGPDGTFTLASPPVPDGRLEIRARGYAQATIPLPPDTTGRPVTVRLVAEGRLRVRLEPAPPATGHVGWQVDGEWWHDDERVLVPGRADAEYVLFGLTAGDHVVKAFARDAAGARLIGETKVRVVPGATGKVVIRLRPE